MLQTLFIAFREGLEALLIIAITTLYLRRTGRAGLLGAVRSGVATALALSALLGYALAQVGALSPAWEGTMAWVAAAAVVTCTVHMAQAGRQLRQQIGSRLDASSARPAAGAWLSVFLFSVFMVGREGVETAAMIASLAINGDLAYMAWGGAIGFAAAAVIAWLWVRYGNRIDLARFFRVTAVFMLLFALQLMVYGFHEFTETGLVPGIDNAYWHAATEDLAEGSLAFAISLALVALPPLWLAAAYWQDRRRGAAALVTGK